MCILYVESSLLCYFVKCTVLNIVLRLLLQRTIEIIVIAIIFSSYILMINFALYHVVYIASLSSNASIRHVILSYFDVILLCINFAFI